MPRACRVFLFTGLIPDDDLPLLLNSADIFAMPSGTELQSIATLEAMSSGLPVLAANARALPELVNHKENGYLFKLNSVSDAARGIAFLADNKNLWPQMSAAGLAKADTHSLSNTIRQYADLYKKLVALPETNLIDLPSPAKKLPPASPRLHQRVWYN